MKKYMKVEPIPACFCCSSMAVFGIAVERFEAQIRADPNLGAEEYLQRLDHELYEATLHRVRRHHQGPVCEVICAHRAARERFANWREMGATPGAREWLESMGMHSR